jgi:hypothetical protein
VDVEPDRRDPDASRLTRADLVLRGRAVRARWAVPPELIVETLFQVQEILADTSAEPRLKLAAGRLLATLVRVDQAEDRIDLEKAKVAGPEAADARDAWQDLHDELKRDG